MSQCYYSIPVSSYPSTTLLTPSEQEAFLLAGIGTSTPTSSTSSAPSYLNEHLQNRRCSSVSRLHHRPFLECIHEQHSTRNPLIAALRNELDGNVIDTSTDFVHLLFPSQRLPFAIDDGFFDKLSKPYTADDNIQKPAVWNNKQGSFRYQPQHCSMANWLNDIGDAIARVSQCKSTRIWLCRSDNQVDSPLILVDNDYHRRLQSSPYTPANWRFIRAFGEVTSQDETSKRIIDTINVKSYVMFRSQHNRRFVIALSFTGRGTFALTVTDREGQVRLVELPLMEGGKKHATVFFKVLAFLMFGSNSSIGLDPAVEMDAFGSVRAISVDDKRFEVAAFIYGIDTLVGQGTSAWIVTHGGVRYILKDSWVQEDHIELSLLQKMLPHDDIKGSVPTLFCGGDVTIDGVKDCTGNFRVDLSCWPYSQRVHRRIVTTPATDEALITFRSKEFIGVIMTIIRTHRYLYNILGILHRNINVNNILLNRSDARVEAIGLLVDFEHGELWKDATRNIPEGTSMVDATSHSIPGETVDEMGDAVETFKNVRTGAPPFMAIETLISVDPHFTYEPRHDLESILYVILYLCTFAEGPGLLRPQSEMLEERNLLGWFGGIGGGSFRSIGYLKTGHMVRPDLAITPGFAKYWCDFVPFVLRLTAACFPRENPAQPNHLTHEGMLSADAVMLIRHLPITITNPWCKYSDTKCTWSSDASLPFAESVLS